MSSRSERFLSLCQKAAVPLLLSTVAVGMPVGDWPASDDHVSAEEPILHLIDPAVQHGHVHRPRGTRGCGDAFPDDAAPELGSATEFKTATSDIRYKPLANGMRVILVSDPGCQAPTCALTIRAGNLLGVKEAQAAMDALTAQSNTTTFRNVDMLHSNIVMHASDRALPGAVRELATGLSGVLNGLDCCAKPRYIHTSEMELGAELAEDVVFKRQQSSVDPKDPEAMHNAAEKFIKQYYSPSEMALVVTSNRSLDQMERTVVPLFEALPSKKVHVPRGGQYVNNNSTPIQRMTYLPGEDCRFLKFSWAVNGSKSFPNCDPAAYACTLMEHDSPNGLLKALIDTGAVKGAYVKGPSGLLDRDLLTLNVVLNKNGDNPECVKRIGEIIFAAIKHYQNSPADRNFCKCIENNARYHFDRSPESFALGTAALAHSPNYFLAAAGYARSPSSRSARGSAYKNVLDQLGFDNLQVTYGSPAVKDKCVQTDPQSKLAYGVEAIPANYLDAWSKVDSTKYGFKFPNRSKYVPENFVLRYPRLGEGLTGPVQDVTTDGIRGVLVPKRGLCTRALVSLRPSMKITTGRQRAIMELLLALTYDRVESFEAPSRHLGHRCTLLRNEGYPMKAVLCVDGNADKLPVLAEDVISAMIGKQHTKAEFESAKKSVLSHLNDYLHRIPCRTRAKAIELLGCGAYNTKEIIEELERIKFGEWQEITRWMPKFQMEVSVKGNMSPGEARSFVVRSANAMKRAAGVETPTESIEPDFIDLGKATNKNTRFLCTVDNGNAPPRACVLMQIDADSIPDKAMAGIAGLAVCNMPLSIGDVYHLKLGMPGKEVLLLEDSDFVRCPVGVGDLLVNVKLVAAHLTADSFASMKVRLEDIMTSPPLAGTVDDEGARLVGYGYDPETRQKVLDCLASPELTFERFQTFLQDKFMSCPMLGVQPPTKPHKATADWNVVTSSDDIAQICGKK